MEYLDILTREGYLTGQKALREEVHSKGLWHKAVHIWILNSKGEILLQKRSAKKESSPNMWDISVAGHVSAGENSFQAAIKEIHEEIGLSIKESDLTLIGTMSQVSIQTNGKFINNEIDDVYVVFKDLNPASIKLQEGEVSKVKFISQKTLKDMVSNHDPLLVLHDKEFKALFDYLDKQSIKK